MSSSASHKGDVHGEKDIDRKGYKKRPSPEDPFAHLKLSPHDPLINASRTSCTGPCAKKRRYFCAECLISLLPQGSHMPQVHLPVKLHILQAGAEQPQRSTAQHIPLLSPDARVWRPFPECIEQFKTEVVADAEEGSVAVLYPSERALTPQQAVKDLPNLRHVIALDANWPKSAVLMAEPMFNCLPHLSLPPGKPTLFWRYAPSRSEHSKYFSPDKVPLLMSTVESVHRFCDEYNRALGKEQHSCDDLLWLFAFLHSRVRDVYQHAPGKRQRIMRKSKGLLHQF